MTLEQLRAQYENDKDKRKASRFHKSPCPVCLKLVTNQAMGRKAHIRAHERAKARYGVNVDKG